MARNGVLIAAWQKRTRLGHALSEVLAEQTELVDFGSRAEICSDCGSRQL